jgi:hypothetical protein
MATHEAIVEHGERVEAISKSSGESCPLAFGEREAIPGAARCSQQAKSFSAECKPRSKAGEVDGSGCMQSRHAPQMAAGLRRARVVRAPSCFKTTRTAPQMPADAPRRASATRYVALAGAVLTLAGIDRNMSKAPARAAARHRDGRWACRYRSATSKETLAVIRREIATRAALDLALDDLDLPWSARQGGPDGLSVWAAFYEGIRRLRGSYGAPGREGTTQDSLSRR